MSSSDDSDIEDKEIFFMAEIAALEEKTSEEENNHELDGEADLEGEFICALDKIEKLRRKKWL